MYLKYNLNLNESFISYLIRFLITRINAGTFLPFKYSSDVLYISQIPLQVSAHHSSLASDITLNPVKLKTCTPA